MLYRYNLHIYLYSHLFEEMANCCIPLTHYNAPPTAFTIHMAILTCKPTLRSVLA
jgi:hypothetical protein